MKAAIVIDDWKLGIFEQHLNQSFYGYTKSRGLSDGTLILTVVTDNVEALEIVVRAANTEARQTGKLS